MGMIQSLADILSMVRRRFLPIAAILLFGTLATFFIATQRPHLYESVAVLQVELPRVSTEVAEAEAISHSVQRLKLLEQELTSRTAILGLAERHRLFADTPGMSATQKVVALRASIRIDTVRAGPNAFALEQPVSAMLISVRSGTAQQAAAVANDLAAQVVASTTERQTARVRETLEFYGAEDNRLAAAVAALEADITAFKNANVDALPEGLAGRHDEMVRVDEALLDIEAQLLTIGQELALLNAGGTPRAVEQRQIAILQSRREVLLGQQRNAQERRVQIVASINRAPMVETQLGTFARQLVQLQDQYSVITRRRAEAETSERLDTERQTERFTLLEEALPADYPLASGRRKLMVFGVFGSFVLAMGVAFLLEFLNPVLRSARQMERVLGLKPVIVLPKMAAPPRPDRPQKGSRLLLVVVAALIGAAVWMGGILQSALVAARGPVPLAEGASKSRRVIAAVLGAGAGLFGIVVSAGRTLQGKLTA